MTAKHQWVRPRIDVWERILKYRSIDPVSGCWNWTGFTNFGYGLIKVGSKTDHTDRVERVHRISFEKFVRKFEKGEIACHKCDNRRCFNPEHLFAGQHMDNHLDAMQKGRLKPPPHPTGDDHYRRKRKNARLKMAEQLANAVNTP